MSPDAREVPREGSGAILIPWLEAQRRARLSRPEARPHVRARARALSRPGACPLSAVAEVGGLRSGPSTRSDLEAAQQWSAHVVWVARWGLNDDGGCGKAATTTT
jgi:hypothetical protein